MSPVVGTQQARTRARRLAYLDMLKVLLVALIVVWHGIAGYTDLASAWPYQDVQEVALAEFSNNLLAMMALPGVLFAMGVFFLISGLVTPGSLPERGHVPSPATGWCAWACRWCCGCWSSGRF